MPHEVCEQRRKAAVTNYYCFVSCKQVSSAYVSDCFYEAAMIEPVSVEMVTKGMLSYHLPFTTGHSSYRVSPVSQIPVTPWGPEIHGP